ncbi:hypothetical protein BH11BAC3_BH11BAC3_35440 [soil metagenome]
MKTYFNKSEAVIDLHERGFTEDFQLIGTNLLWIQRKIFLREKDFSIVEYHSFIDSFGKETIIFGVFAKGYFASGILINHYKSYTDKTPAIIQSKLKKMGSGLLNIGGNYVDVLFIH